VIERSDTSALAADPPVKGSAVVPAPVGSAEPPPAPPVKPPPSPPAAADYGRLLVSHQAGLQKCVADNGGNEALPADAAMKIEITGTGAATTTLSPPALDRTELGACIKREVAKVKFPPAEHELKIRLRR
jgi:hypothetical protein